MSQPAQQSRGGQGGDRPPVLRVPPAVYDNLQFSTASDPEKKETLARADTASSTDSHGNGFDAGPAAPAGFGRRTLASLGVFGSTILLGGGAAVLAVLALLLFLWAPALGTQQVTETSAVWRWLAVSDSRPLALLQTITVLTALARLATAAQATLATSLLAAVVLESPAGVPLFRVPEFSVMRSASHGRGPLRLAWLLLRSSAANASPREVLFAALAAALLVLSAAVQFSSAILISDLGRLRVPGAPGQALVPVLMSADAFRAAATRPQTARSWLETAPSAWVPFGEGVAPRADMAPSRSGVSDTGLLRRVFLPLPQDGEASLRRYVGPGYALDARYVCVPPVVDAALSVAPTTDVPPADRMPFHSNITGSINYGATFGGAGLAFDSSCSAGSCFPSTIDCTIPSLVPPTQQAGNTSSQFLYGGQAYGVCVLPGADASSNPGAAQAPLLGNAGSSIAPDAKVILLSRNNGNWLSWSFQNGGLPGQPRQGLNGTIRVPSADATSSQDGEWTKLQLVNGVVLELSLCFQQVAVSVTDVDVSRAADAVLPSTGWNRKTGMLDTSSARNMLGAMSNSTSRSSRGIFTMNPVGNSRERFDNTTQYFVNQLLLKDLPASGRSLSMIMQPMATSYSSLQPEMEYQALFADILATTGRPAMGLHSIMTAAMGSVVNKAVTSGLVDVPEAAAVTASVDVLAPERFVGLAIVMVLLLLHLLCVVGITTQFLTRTKFSGRGKGNHWQTIAQVVSVGTKRTFEGAVERTDKEIGAMLGNGDIRVRIDRCPYTGRVTIVPLDMDCLKEWKAQVDAGG